MRWRARSWSGASSTPADPGAPPPATTADRFAARARARERLRRRLLVAGAVVVVTTAVAGWVVFSSPLLDLRTVEVDGEKRLSDADITLAAVPELGRPLARVDTEAVRRRVLEHPEIESVEVTRDWPHTLRVEVVERQAVAVVRLSERFGLLDAEGRVFAEDTSLPGGLPVVRADAGSPETLRAAAAVVVALPGRLRSEVATVDASSPEAVVLRMRDGASVVWGSAERSDRKAEVLQALRRHDADVYDVSAPDAPTTRG